jgi:hypothetical protein
LCSTQACCLRFVHITRGVDLDIALLQDGTPVSWQAVAKDGADLPPALRIRGPARIHTNTGETFDYLWTPMRSGTATITISYDLFLERQQIELTHTLRVR